MPGPQPTEADPAEPGAAIDQIFASQALPKFLQGLAARPDPVLVDLGPFAASNLRLFADELGCKVFIEDLSRDFDRHVQQGRLAALPGFLSARFPRQDGSVDGVICWDLFDYCDRDAAHALARELTRLLRSDGLLLAFFSTVGSQDARYTKFMIADGLTLQVRPYPAARGKQEVLANREIARLFDGLRLSDSFLLRNRIREMLFRKPGYFGGRHGEGGKGEGR